MKTKGALSSHCMLVGLLLTSMLQGCGTRVLEPIVIPAMLIADTLPAGTPSTPRPQGYELALTAGYFPYMHVTPAKYRPDGQPRLQVSALSVDDKPVERLITKEDGVYGEYPRIRKSTDTPIERGIVADIVEADGAPLRLNLPLGDVIKPAEYLGGGRILVQVRPGTIVVSTTTQGGCRSGFNVRWCPKGNTWAHVWERVPGQDPRYLGKITLEQSHQLLPLDYEALQAKYPPSPTIELVVWLEKKGGLNPSSRCLAYTEFSLELNGAPAQLKPILFQPESKLSPDYGNGHCPRYSLLSPLSGTAETRLTVRLPQDVRVYEGVWSVQPVQASGAGLTFRLPSPPASALIVRTDRHFRSESDGTYRWRASLPGNPQYTQPVGELRLIGAEQSLEETRGAKR